MGSISEDSIKRVLEATDIVGLINGYVPLKRAGSAWKGICPFHNDTKPSMTVNPTRQIFKCFACNTGGDAFSFVMKYENMPFVDAVRKLADRAGVMLIEDNYDPSAERRRKVSKSLVEINQLAAEHFHTLLKKSPLADHARSYLSSRGYGAQMSDRWNVGWAPERSSDLLKWARSMNISENLLVEAGLASRDESGKVYFRFRDRLMFPIHNDRGECVGFSGRVLKDIPNVGKYVNTPETPIFKKSQLCFGLDKAQKGIRDAQAVLICEGQVDVIACHEAGVDYTVASLGTALTPEHARLLKRRTDTAILCFDGDTAGIKASERAFRSLAAEGMNVKVVTLPSFENGKGDDPDSFIKREGAEAFQALLSSAVPFIPSRIEMARAKGRLNDAGSAAAFALEIADLIASMKDPIARDMAASDAATRLRTGIDELKQSVHTVVRQGTRRTVEHAYNDSPEGTVPQEKIRPALVHRAVQVLCELALQNAVTQELIAERIEGIIEPLEILPGGEILKTILRKSPNPSDPAEISTFIRSLPADQALAVEGMHLDPVRITLPGEVVDEACAGLAYFSLEKQLNETLSALKSPVLTTEERLGLMKKSVDMKKLLNNINPRKL